MYLDLTHTITESMPVYPGTQAPKIFKRNTIPTDGFAEIEVSMYSHTGTHIDAPAHMISNGKTLDQYPISHFIGKAFLLDISSQVPSIESLEKKRDRIIGCDYLVIRTDWSDYWGSPKYFDDFPVLPKTHIDWFMKFELKGFATDTISIDSIHTTAFENHHLILSKGLTITENLTNLKNITSETFEITMLPLKVLDSDGYSARVIAKI